MDMVVDKWLFREEREECFVFIWSYERTELKFANAYNSLILFRTQYFLNMLNLPKVDFGEGSVERPPALVRPRAMYTDWGIKTSFEGAPLRIVYKTSVREANRVIK